MTASPDLTGREVHAQYADAGRHLANAVRVLLFVIGWLLAKTCRLIATVVGLLLFGTGFVAGRVVRPAWRWSAAAVRLGWQQGIRPVEEPRPDQL